MTDGYLKSKTKKQQLWDELERKTKINIWNYTMVREVVEEYSKSAAPVR